MAFDANLLFYDGASISTEAETSTIVTVSKTPAGGIGIELACTATTSSTGTLDVVVKASDSTTTGFVTVATFAQITSAGGVRHVVVQSKKKYLELVGTPGGTLPGFTLTAGIVSGPSAGYQTA